ncbi:MAG: hypothetical protein P8N94_05585 [Gammaproteobacteria bacterium]|nr:hypothetical protein [Gammaproteobacteria bacterium]MDG2337445.1 hypothetical protein [Gammaproteobacteria bacterium]
MKSGLVRISGGVTVTVSEIYMELQNRLTKAASSLNVLSTTRIY